MLKIVGLTLEVQAGMGAGIPTRTAPHPLGTPKGTKRSILTSYFKIGI